MYHVYSGLKKLCKPNIIKGSSQLYRGINKEANLQVDDTHLYYDLYDKNKTLPFYHTNKLLDSSNAFHCYFF
jgi:hypothetical protein